MVRIERARGSAGLAVNGAVGVALRPHMVHVVLTRLISLAAVIGAALPVARWAKAAKSRLGRDVTIADFMTDTMFV